MSGFPKGLMRGLDPRIHGGGVTWYFGTMFVPKPGKGVDGRVEARRCPFQ